MIKRFWRIGLCVWALAFLPTVPAYAESRIPEGVYADEVNLGGLTREEANQAIEDYIQTLSNHKITLNMGEDKADTTAGNLGIFWSNQEAVEEALTKYQGGNLIKRYMNSVDLKAESETIEVELSVDGGKGKRVY